MQKLKLMIFIISRLWLNFYDEYDFYDFDDFDVFCELRDFVFLMNFGEFMIFMISIILCF